MGGWVGGPQDLSVSPIPLGTDLVFELIGTWLGLGTKGFRLGLGNNSWLLRIEFSRPGYWYFDIDEISFNVYFLLEHGNSFGNN